MKIQGRRSSLRITSIFGFNVRRLFPTRLPLGVPTRHPVLSMITIVGTLTCCILERNGRKTLTTVQGLPKKFDQKKILKVIKKKFGKQPLSDS